MGKFGDYLRRAGFLRRRKRLSVRVNHLQIRPFVQNGKYFRVQIRKAVQKLIMSRVNFQNGLQRLVHGYCNRKTVGHSA